SGSTNADVGNRPDYNNQLPALAPQRYTQPSRGDERCENTFCWRLQEFLSLTRRNRKRTSTNRLPKRRGGTPSSLSIASRSHPVQSKQGFPRGQRRCR